MSGLATRLARYQERVEGVLARALELPDCGTARLREAMRYSALGGGKRLRPILVYVTGESLGAPLERLDAAAAAVELIHVYSLVHDDLPAMDDDDLRRGRPTCHRAFDEATAMLAGDAMQALAFGVLAEQSRQPADARLTMLRLLAGAAGTAGMAGGQAIDLESVGKDLTAGAVEDMHLRKTGALIEGSVLIGAVAAGLAAGPEFEALRRYGADIGLAFQIQDDILDVEGNTDALGKRAGADAERVKPTYPSVLGLEAARVQAVARRDRAIAALAPWGARYANLVEFAHFLVTRAS
jgi:geranylgeranyl diphosphate synthase type II